jgi:antitoxin component YwqK of YwqJK toxin-antitoxin module
MEQFKIREGGFSEIRKRSLTRSVPLVVIAVLAGVGISYFNNSGKPTDFNVYPIVIPICLAAAGFGLFRSMKRQKKIFDSYILTIGDGVITREQDNTSLITIPFNEIAEIYKNINGSFTIKGRSATELIVVPAQINDHEKLEKLLGEIKPFTVRADNPLMRRFGLGIVILPLALMAVVALSDNKIIVGVSGISLLAIMIYGLYTIQRNKNLSYQIKRSSWWVIVVCISIGGTTFYKLTMDNISSVSDLPALGFTNKTEATNSRLHGKKQGKWITYTDSSDNATKDTNAPYYYLAVYDNGKLTGMYRKYSHEGIVLSEVPYTRGIKNGTEKDYYDDGKLWIEVPFVNDTESGTEKSYYESGALQWKAHYVAGLENDTEKHYYENGVLKEETPFTNDTENGIAKGYYENGDLKWQVEYTNGEMGVEKDYPEKKKKSGMKK